MMKLSMSLLTSAAIFALGPLSGNCAEVGVVIDVPPPPPPPPPKLEMAPIAPAVGYVWRPGYWRWVENRYVWIAGAFVVPPQPRAVWVPGHWTPVGGGWVWAAGYWRR